MYKIRFHLARGDNFMKWQVRSTDGNVVEYYRPEKECKTVCAWIECDDFQVLGQPDFVKPNVNDFYVRFNPRHNPNWVDMHGNIMNDEKYNLIVTQDRSLFVVTENHECEE
jgi:hypothetical protein